MRFIAGKGSSNLTTLDPNYDVSMTFKDFEIKDYKNVNHSVVQVEMFLSRIVTSHILQTFLPSLKLCIISTGSVFIPSHIVPGRMGLAITSFLSLISLFNGARGDWIECSYLRAIDIWTILCYINVFAALLEYCVVLYLTKAEKLELNKVNNGAETSKISRKETQMIRAWKVEQMTRFILPIYNVMFVVVFIVTCIMN